MKRLTPLLFALLLALLCACGSPDAEATITVTRTEPVEASGQPSDEPSLALPPEEPSEESSLSLPPEEEPSGTPEPSEQPSVTPSAQPEPSAVPEPAVEPEPSTEPQPSLSVLPAEPGDEVCGLPLAPSDAAEEIDLQAFYDELLFDDPEFSASAQLYNEYLDVCYPGLTAIPTRQLVVYQPMMSAVVCEIALVEVEDSADVMDVISVLQARVAAQVGTEDEPGGAWYPASIESWQNNSRIVSHGRYVMLIAYDKCDDVTAAFDALF